MNSVLTAEELQLDQDEVTPASGNWEFSLELPRRQESSFARSILHHAGLAPMLAVSPMTFGADPWFVDRRRQSALTLQATFEAIAGRSISLLEARKIALQILSRAEHDRAHFAEEEAQRGIDWGFDQ